MRSVYEIGALWPFCTTCGHIAQEHDNSSSCGASVIGQCPACGTHNIIKKCSCDGYKGMTREEWFALLTPEEIRHYRYSL